MSRGQTLEYRGFPPGHHVFTLAPFQLLGNYQGHPGGRWQQPVGVRAPTPRPHTSGRGGGAANILHSLQASWGEKNKTKKTETKTCLLVPPRRASSSRFRSRQPPRALLYSAMASCF